MKLQVSRIKITNVLGIEDLEIEPGAVTVVEGRNGQGKSSVLDAIRSAIGGGHDATLIRNGAKAGEVVLEFEDGSRLTSRITPSGSKRTFTDGNGVPVKKTQSYLDSIRDTLSANPIVFCDAPAKKRIELLAAAVPAEMSKERIEEAAGCPLPHHLPLVGGALEVIGTAEAHYYEARRDVNAELRQAKETVASLEGAIPEGAEDLEAIRNALAADERSREAELDRLRAEAEEIEQFWRDADAESNARRESEIEEARKVFEEAKARAHAEYQSSRETALSNRDRRLSEINAEAKPKIEELTARIAQTDERLSAATKAAGALEVLDRSRRVVAEKDALAERLDAAVKATRKLREEILEDLPIRGLEVKDGEIHFEGVPWPHLEESRRVWLAVQIAQLRSGELGLICIDGLERLDEARFAAFVESLLATGAQLIGARVTDGELAVTYPD